MRYGFFAVFFTLLLSITNPVQADSYPWEQKRALFKEAREALAKGDKGKLAKLKPQLQDYPLFPYIEYTELASSFWNTRNSDIDAFFSSHPDGPASRRLRSHWLNYLIKKDQWQDYPGYYLANNASTEQQCYYQLARFRSGEKASAMSEGLKLWTVGKSQPKGCDKLFALLIKNKAISEDVAWQRYVEAVLNHEYSLATYIERFFISTAYQRKAKAYLKVDRSPFSIVAGPVDTNDLPENRDIIKHGITHLARSHPAKAYDAWLRYYQQLSFSETQQADMLAAIVKGLARKDDQRHADDVLRDHGDKIPLSVFEWRLRSALANQDWPTVRYWIYRLPGDASKDTRWQYWLARADEVMAVSDGSEAKAIYTILAQQRDYYGYLSAQHLGLPYLLNTKASIAPAEVQAQVLAEPAMVRARELFYVGEILEAKREWAFAGKNFDRDQWIAAASLATDWGWENRAIHSLIAAKTWDDTEQRFPMAYQDSYRKQAAANKLKPSILAAITRQESAFDPWAVSGSDARGLMQLLPKTAKYIANKKNIRLKGTKELFVPA
jgi:soluble lytic murein transglycosylase